MAESSEKNRRDDDDDEREDERDEDERDEEDEDGDDEKGAAEAKPPPAKKAAAEPAPKPKKKAKKRPAEAPVKAQPLKAQPVQGRQPGALGKSLVLFIIVVGGLALGFAVLGREEKDKPPPTPKWNVGQTVDVEITVVPTDRQDLACASKEQIEGRHCQFEERNRPMKPGDPDDKILKPYTTTDRVQFLAAGLWDQPTLKAKLPSTRFSVKCKYKVEGKLPKPWIRWAADGQWFERVDEWYAGPVQDCVLVQ